MPRTSFNTDLDSASRAPPPASADDVELPGLIPDEPLPTDDTAEVFRAEDGYVVDDEPSAPTPGNEPRAGETLAQPAAADAKEETEAREFGWVNKDEWLAAGKPEKQWRPAADFNAFRAQAAPVLAKENRELRRRLATLEKNDQIKSEADREAREALARESLTLRLRQAQENNDWDEVFKIQNEALDLKLASALKPQAKQAPADPETVEAFNAFIGANAIVKTDTKLQRALARQVKLILDSGTAGETAAETLADAWDEVKRMYPEKFRRPTAPMADAGGTSGSSTTVNGRSWNDLKPEVRVQYDRFLRDNPIVKRENLLKRFPDDFYRS